MSNLDFNGLNFDISPAINSVQLLAKQFEERDKILDQISRDKAKKDAAMIAGAEASVAQKELLEEQLKEIKEQNLQLKENYRLLNELYESAKKEAQDNAKEARHNKIFGWVSFGVGTFIGIIGIVFGIIF